MALLLPAVQSVRETARLIQCRNNLKQLAVGLLHYESSQGGFPPALTYEGSEDPPLARALHRDCEIGDEVPEDLFQAVAGVLAYVYRVQGGAPVTA